MAVFGVLVLAAPLLVLATVVVALCSYGPLGWVAAAGLLAAVGVVARSSYRVVLRWWRRTKAPSQVRMTPAERRRRLY